ncbi:HU family DNA-binding protein [Dysgonomonas sp. GY617]|uniref:HU family DNA-binding protein n=1 Tax=Dysgonomonas sp. GY617 TaxID=2780420 RepID=UPI0018841D00|nr:HU family DNA-binding protein [Dysgonomonas sp. GY617]MBF0578035.1 HU family DNA-binding protein [Dysgonomonas sp. GY617]
MNDKLSLQDLVDILSKKAKITKKDADSFFREFFQLILERIFDNDSVKVKDFGTFKLISVSSRESVNVNTGEKIEIPSHYKLSFLPDKILKNLVNKPFSQFETILLEDGVVFDASVDNSENAVEDEVVESQEIDIENEDESIVSEIEKPIVVESAPIIDNVNNTPVREKDIDKVNSEKESRPQDSSKQRYPQSFVYTYTSSKPSEESDSIILTVPKDDLVRPVVSSEPEIEEVIQEEAPVQKEFPIELLDLPHVPVDGNDEEEEEEDVQEEDSADKSTIVEESEEVAIEGEKVEDIIEDVQSEVIEDEEEVVVESVPLVEPLSKNIVSDDLELESDFDSEIETEEDIIIPAPIPVIERLAKKETSSVDRDAQNKIKEEKKAAFSNEDPERPLFPVEEEEVVTEMDFVPLGESGYEGIEASEANEKEPVIPPVGNQRSYAGNNKPAETRSVSFSDTIDPVDIPYHDFNSPDIGSRFRKWLPMIAFLLVIVASLTYGLIKMLNKPYDFESNLGRTNLSLTDTLPFIDEVSPMVEATDAMLDSMKKVQAQAVEDTVKTMKKEPIVPIAKEPAVEPKVEAVKAAIVGETDSLTRGTIDAEKNSFVISDKLKFGILNKAEFHLGKYKNESKAESASGSQVKPQVEPKVEAKPASDSKAKYATIRKGTTLRTLATTHYGNPDYWVYIYQANKKNIANPNNVPIGTSLLIPPLSDYGVYNPSDAREIQVAKNLEAKILRLR